MQITAIFVFIIFFKIEAQLIYILSFLKYSSEFDK